MNTPSNPPLVAIFGPTASGKSALAMRIATRFAAEIVSADSRQVYRYMDIGTDKPPVQDRHRVPHHMIDVVNPDEAYTLALYQEQARSAIDGVHTRGRLPLLVGGTPLYVNSIIEGWAIPRVEPDVVLRASLEEEARASGPVPLHDRLRALDPRAADSILPSNTRRIIRALEVIAVTGKPISDQQSKSLPPYRILALRLDCDRGTLYRRIDERVDGYVERGLVDEVRGLLERGYSPDLPSMSGIGYRQMCAYLDGRSTLEDAIQRIKWDTHAFVRHQQNWFRRQREAHLFDVTIATPSEEAEKLVERFLAAT